MLLVRTLAGVLLVAGGIGITPMRTMFAECIARGIPVTLLYSVRLLEDAAFLAEFQEVREELHPVLPFAIQHHPADKWGMPDEVLNGIPHLSETYCSRS